MKQAPLIILAAASFLAAGAAIPASAGEAGPQPLTRSQLADISGGLTAVVTAAAATAAGDDVSVRTRAKSWVRTNGQVTVAHGDGFARAQGDISADAAAWAEAFTDAEILVFRRIEILNEIGSGTLARVKLILVARE